MRAPWPTPGAKDATAAAGKGGEAVKSTTAVRIRRKCAELAELLVEKNRAYGDSALRPVGVFARGEAEDLIRVRLDDKLGRIRNAPDAFGEDAVMDMCGYLILLLLAREDNERKEATR